MARTTLFRKAVAAIILLLVPTLILYGYSNKVSVNVVKDEIQSSSLSQLSFFLRQFDSNVEQLSLFPVILGFDPYVRAFIEHRGGFVFDTLKEQSRISEKISLQSVSSPWTNELSVFLPQEKKVVSSNIFKVYDAEYVKSHLPLQQWSYEKIFVGSAEIYHFVRQYADPANSKTPEQVNAMLQVAFPIDNIVTMLDQVKAGGKGDPFLYQAGMEPIMNGTSDSVKIHQLIGVLGPEPLLPIGHRVVVLGGRQYSVNFVQSGQLGWYLVDYLPVDAILKPITMSSLLFYVSFGLLLLLGLAMAYLLYRHVQYPIRKLLQGVQQMRKGDLSTRIHAYADNEFDFLFDRFNGMAEQIQELVEDVYEEKIRRREATLKQLQAQINPHFLYNSLFFIINTAKLGDQESVVAMAQNLAEYYRYTTRVEEQNVPLQEELQLVESYLAIHNLRLQRLYYDIEVPEAMQELTLPRLLLQPLVENAIVHGIEHIPGDGVIRIRGSMDGGRCRLTVEDNGTGLAQGALQELRDKLLQPMDSGMGCGVWNVHQRLQYAFGETAGLTLESSGLGGLRVTLEWNPEEGKERKALIEAEEGGDDSDGGAADRR
ncbi:sensor histidine kinase [Paenibacillus cremeus]|uniref:Sensor histidine kinase n=1 Tax=Paenibacillus cremeus TaxID=2163881 RepID=A0A559K753_9BACL|nr:sensor histidine kinase [Paenibacillus cremeus]TVY07960.1 sensor histidine kinase [Paenibacillus cremeus]